MQNNKISIISKPKSPISEAYRLIRTNIEFSNVDRNLKVVMVTSSKQGEGKSTVISNIAVSFANIGKKVLLLEGDLRNPSIHRIFNISNSRGITNILVNDKEISECINTIDNITNLHIITGGKKPSNPSEMLSSNKMKNIINSLRGCYDYIFIDTPPIGVITDAGVVASYSDGCILVVGSNEVDIELTKISKERLQRVNAHILGVILNKYKDSDNSYYDYYYYGEE